VKPINILTAYQKNIFNNTRQGAPRSAPFSGAQTNQLLVAFGDNEDVLEISELAKSLNEAEDEVCPHAKRLEERMARMREVSEGLRQAREASEGAGDMWRIKLKTLEIARRIIRGDNVPADDYSFLAEHNPELFKKAVSMRDMNNDDPTDYDSISESDENALASEINELIGGGSSSQAVSMTSAPSSE